MRMNVEGECEGEHWDAITHLIPRLSKVWVFRVSVGVDIFTNTYLACLNRPITIAIVLAVTGGHPPVQRGCEQKRTAGLCG